MEVFFPSPIGEICFSVYTDGVKRVYLSLHGINKTPSRSTSPHISQLIDKLNILFKRYFLGVNVDFSSIPLIFRGIPPVYKRIYEFLTKVPYGTVITYSDLAEKVGIPSGARAVGGAMARNPFLILVPCHRVVGKKSLGGFSLGMDVKKYLLRLEGVNIYDL